MPDRRSPPEADFFRDRSSADSAELEDKGIGAHQYPRASASSPVQTLQHAPLPSRGLRTVAGAQWRAIGQGPVAPLHRPASRSVEFWPAARATSSGCGSRTRRVLSSGCEGLQRPEDMRRGRHPDRRDRRAEGYRRGAGGGRGLGARGRDVRRQAEWIGAFSHRAHTLNLSLQGGGTFGADVLPAYDLFSLGGFLRLSGLQPNRLLGRSLAFGRAVYGRRLAEVPLLSGLYGGFSLEAERISRPLLPGAPEATMAAAALFLDRTHLRRPRAGARRPAGAVSAPRRALRTGRVPPKAG